jgi:outer membrane protein assembly factor BamB
MTERNQGPSAAPLWPALLTVLLCAGLSIPAAAAAAEEAEDLSTFKVCQSRTGYLPEGPQPPLELRWKFQSRESRHDIEGFPSVDDGFSPASVHDGVVYAGGHDGWIYAIDAKTGKKIWDYKTGDHVMTTPQYHGGRIYAGSMDGYFRALDAADGSLVWQTKFGARRWNLLLYSGMRATPVFHDGKIFMGG